MGNPSAMRNKVAIIGMGCTRFGENWDQDTLDMIIDATSEATQDAGVELKDIEAGWMGTIWSPRGAGGMTLAYALKLGPIPLTRVENACATSMDALRHAAFAVALGLHDVALVVGFEKLKDSGLSGLPDLSMHPVYGEGATAPGLWALAATRYFEIHGLSPEEGKRALAKIAVKNHYNGSRNPKAHLRKEVTLEQVMNAPMIAFPLGLFDCCGVCDGAAAAIICRADLAKNYRDDYVLIKGLGLASGPGFGLEDFDHKLDYMPETEVAAKLAYEQADIKDPRKELDLVILHDCFTIAELLEYEALGISPKGGAIADIDAGTFTLTGELPVNTDGGLKAFGHPVGATGLRMCYEVYKQLQGKAQLPERQLKDPVRGLAMAQGGTPGTLQPFITILEKPA